MQKENDCWISSWFNTPYYHILYKDRDHREAAFFMDALTQRLNLKENMSILDLACGRGRHSKYLSRQGFDVTGLDLSPESIAYAKQYENPSLHFEVHDMCEPYKEKFDAVFNLFTSFGYFEKEEDNLRTIKAIKADLKSTGFGVIDFLNSKKVIDNLIPTETKIVGDITFDLTRYLDGDYIIKDIRFTDNGENYFYKERVKALTLNDFKEYFNAAGVELIDIFGDYRLHEFDENTSDRLILIFK